MITSLVGIKLMKPHAEASLAGAHGHPQLQPLIVAPLTFKLMNLFPITDLHPRPMARPLSPQVRWQKPHVSMLVMTPSVRKDKLLGWEQI